MSSRVLIDRAYGATMENVSALCEAIESLGEREGIDPDIGMRLMLVAEELTSNVVRHGFQGGEGSFEMRIELDGSEVTLFVTDGAPAFNPIQRPAPDHLDLPLEDRPIGGLGLHLVMTSADALAYTRVNDANRTEARFRPRTTE